MTMLKLKSPELYILRFCLLFILGLCPLGSQAKKIDIVKLVVSQNKAPVYQKPNFDAKIIYRLKKNKKVYGTRQLFEGTDGLGLFHKVRLKEHVYGYVLDTDIHILGKSKKPKKRGVLSQKEKKRRRLILAKKKAQRKKRLKKLRENRKKKSKKRSGFQISKSGAFNKGTYTPLFFRQFAGLNLGMMKYAEDLADGERSSKEWLVGLKFTGPNWLFKDFMVDINLNAHFGAPQFFEDFATQASGFIIQADLTFPFELATYTHSSLYAGIGPLLSASKFEFNYLGQDRSTSQLRFGAVLMAGYAYELGGYVLRLEPKYYYESTSYLAFLAGIQKRF